MKKTFIILLTGVLWASVSSAGLRYNYPQLMIMDLDEMNAIVKKSVAEYKKDGSIQILKEAVQAVYSRPNEGGMVEKVIPPLRNELDENDQWEPVMDSLVQEAIGAMKNPKAFSGVVLNTYQTFLENVISDYKPFAEKEGHERKTIEKIRGANIVMVKSEEDERTRRGVSHHKSPSEIAANAMVEVNNSAVENKKLSDAAKVTQAAEDKASANEKSAYEKSKAVEQATDKKTDRKTDRKTDKRAEKKPEAAPENPSDKFIDPTLDPALDPTSVIQSDTPSEKPKPPPKSKKRR